MYFARLDGYSRVRRLASDMARSKVGPAAVERWLPAFPDPCGSAVLDLGCGEGGALQTLARAAGLAGMAVGIDPSSALLERARSRTVLGTRLELVRAQAEALPFPDQWFGLCWCDRVLSHVAVVEHALSEMIRVLRPGGSMFISLFDYCALRWVGQADSRLQALLARYVGSVRHPALAKTLAADLRSCGMLVHVEERDQHSLVGWRQILRGTAALHWARQGVDEGSLRQEDLPGEATRWRAAPGNPGPQLQVDMLTVLASRPE